MKNKKVDSLLQKIILKKNVEKLLSKNRSIFKVFVVDNSNSHAWKGVEVKKGDNAVLLNSSTNKLESSSVHLGDLDEKNLFISIFDVKKIISQILHEEELFYDDKN